MDYCKNINEEMIYYPVIIPTLNRYDHLKKCIESLQANTHAGKTELVIGVDYPPSEKYFDGWSKICEYVKSIDGFKKVTVLFRDENLGPRGNAESLRKYAFENYDALIATEDDNVFSPNFLDYINKGLAQYKYDKNIIAICGYMSPVRFESIDTNRTTVVKLHEYHTWGYGIWKDRDDELNENMPYRYMEYVCRRKNDLKKLHKNPRNLYQLIFWPLFFPVLNGKCDFALSCYCILNNKFTIVPVISLVRNIGSDGSGINTPRIMDERLTQIISDERSFEYKDSLDNLETELVMKIVDEWKTKDCMEVPVKKPWKLLTNIFYLSFMTIGYDSTIYIFNLLRKIKNFFIKSFK